MCNPNLFGRFVYWLTFGHLTYIPRKECARGKTVGCHCERPYQGEING